MDVAAPRRILRRPPGPQGRWLVGNSYDYERDRVGFLRRCQLEYGDVFAFSDTTVVVQDLDLIHELFTRTNAEFRTERPLLDDTVAADRLADSVPAWMTGRRRGWRTMTKDAVTGHATRLIGHLDRVLAETAAREVDVLTVMKRFSGCAIAEVCLGPRSADVADAVEDAANAAVAVMTSAVTVPRWLPTRRVRHVHGTSRRLTEVLAEHVARRRAGTPAEPFDLLDTLLTAGEQRLPDQNVIEILDVVLRASYGVPGAALTWAVRAFALDPELLSAVRAEAAGCASAAATSDLPFTEALVKELLRAYPPTWLMGRIVHRPATLGGWDFRPGDHIMFSPYLAHRDPRWWHDPNRLNPRRWLAATPPHTRHAYFPFGAGPRICLGNQLGMVQLVLATARLAACYDIQVTNAAVAPIEAGALLLPRGLRARFHRR